ncbi:glucose dehydrogenase protein [Rutstroemia sp. NJR-2017a WRK4]|nr:glucose dehydrogenase protein [Rutstroemia sp. NJR-2017a WRK4]
MSIPTEADYIIIGGGLTGSAFTSRLAERLGSSASILILEAGPDPRDNPNATSLGGGFALAGSDLDWAYKTAPIPSLDNRSITLTAGKTLGGGSILNYGGWSRGDRSDYDAWARIVGDERWSYEGLLKYFKRSEAFREGEADRAQHGRDGPMKISSISGSDAKRKYPLREPLLKAWTELGVQRVSSSAGKLAGLSEFLENFNDGVRQPSHLAYDLSGVEVRTNTPVRRILFERSPEIENPRAVGVELADGRHVEARKEIILAAGAIRSPHILQLSGVGPASMLIQHSIPVVYDSPAVGQNMFDHFAFFQVFKLRNPERGLALGHPKLTDPAMFKGMPVDWIVNEALPAEKLVKALSEDGDSVDTRKLGDAGRTHAETMILYSPLAPGVPVDGSFIGTSVMLTLPTSRGSVGLASASSDDPPLIQGNYFSTSTDRAVLVRGARRLLQCLLSTKAGRDVVEAEFAPAPGLEPLTLESSDKEIEDRIRMVGSPHFHVAGTCALGTVLDAELRVKGVTGLRVVDASIFPAPLGGHPQASLYGIADLAAEMIVGSKDVK